MKTVSLDLYKESLLTYEALGELYSKKDKFRGEDFDIIDNIFSLLNKRKIKVLDLGCGNGNFIKYILDNHYEAINKIVGIDFSRSMIESTRKRLNLSEMNKVELVCVDINDYLHSSTSRFDLVLMTNNVLGNILPIDNDFSKDYRSDILTRIQDKIVPCEYVFISVYNKEKLYDDRWHYDNNDWALHEKLSENDFVIRLTIDSKIYYYYTHWFSREEINQLLEKVGFKINSITIKEKRLIITAR